VDSRSILPLPLFAFPQGDHNARTDAATPDRDGRQRRMTPRDTRAIGYGRICLAVI
jgi:hypothetical protein